MIITNSLKIQAKVLSKIKVFNYKRLPFLQIKHENISDDDTSPENYESSSSQNCKMKRGNLYPKEKEPDWKRNFECVSENFDLSNPIYLHWTHKDNLVSIFEIGLKSPRYIKENKIDFKPAEYFSDKTKRFKSYNDENSYRKNIMVNYVRLGNHKKSKTYKNWYSEFKNKEMKNICIFIFDNPWKIKGCDFNYGEYRFENGINKEHLKKIMLVKEKGDFNFPTQFFSFFEKYKQLEECIIIDRKDLTESFCNKSNISVKVVRRKHDNKK